jgi:hypothetical protein
VLITAMTKKWLYLSLWHIGLTNLPEGRFRHRRLTSNEANKRIEQARRVDHLLCVSHDDLLVPHKKSEPTRHAELCAMLSRCFGISLRTRDFLHAEKEGRKTFYSTQPLECATVDPTHELLVISCSYRIKDKRRKPSLAFAIDPDSVTFHLFESV